MRFNNARQCIHDAFATNLTTPDRMEAGGTRFNSNNAIAHQAEAGLIIRAVMEQKPHLRAACIFLNAPDGVVRESELTTLKTRLWSDFIKRKEVGPREQGEMVAIIDRILLNYRRRCHDPKSGDIYTGEEIAKLLGKDPRVYSDTIAGHYNRIVDILHNYDSASLQPVWAVIHEQRDKMQAERDLERATQ
jgi:hypothetical protein